MVLESITFFISMFQHVLTLPPAFILIFFGIFVYVLFKAFHMISKAAVFGAVAAISPFLLNTAGYAMDTSISSIITFGAFGFIGYLIFASVMSFFKLGKFFVKLGLKFRGKKKPQVIIKEVEKKKSPEDNDKNNNKTTATTKR